MEKLEFLRPVTLNSKIRLGNRYDGGYPVYKRILQQVDALVTYGVGWDVAFERDFNQLTGKPVRMFDPTMFGRYLLDIKLFKGNFLNFRFGAMYRQLLFTWRIWKQKKELKLKNVYFVNEGIAAVKKDKYDTFQNHIDRFNLKGSRMILKIDIEGEEYNILSEEAIYNHLGEVDQLIVEFHDLKTRLRDLKKIIANLAENFTLAHVHGNNCGPLFNLYDLNKEGGNDAEIPDTMELLWVRTDKIVQEDLSAEVISYPIRDLDYPNDPDKKEYFLKFL